MLGDVVSLVGTFRIAKEGGWWNSRNRRAAHMYCVECVRRGGKWVRFNDMTQRVEYLHLKVGVKNTWRKKWTLEREESQSFAPTEAKTVATVEADVPMEDQLNLTICLANTTHTIFCKERPQEKKQTPTDPSEHFTIRAPLEASFKHKSSNPKQLIRNAQKHQNGNKTPKFVDVGIVVGIFLAASIFDMCYFAYKVFL